MNILCVGCTATTPWQTTTAPRTTYQSTPPLTTTTEVPSTTTALATTEPFGQTTEEIITSNNIVETTVEIITEIILETATETVTQSTSETVIDTFLQTTAETTLEPTTTTTEQAILETTTEITAASSIAATTEMTTKGDEETIPETTTTTTAAAAATTAAVATTLQPLSASSNQPTTPEELTSTPSRPGQFLTTTEKSLPQVNCCCRCCFGAAEDFESCNLCSNDTLESSFACAFQKPAASPLSTSKPRPISTVPVVYDRPPFVAPPPINGSRFPKRTVETKAFLDGEDFLELMTTLTEQDKIDLGYSLKDMILRCQYADTQCQDR